MSKTRKFTPPNPPTKEELEQLRIASEQFEKEHAKADAIAFRAQVKTLQVEETETKPRSEIFPPPPTEKRHARLRQIAEELREAHAQADALAWGAVAEVWQKYSDQPKPRKRKKVKSQS